jgi:hypothetical protein
LSDTTTTSTCSDTYEWQRQGREILFIITPQLERNEGGGERREGVVEPAVCGEGEVGERGREGGDWVGEAISKGQVGEGEGEKGSLLQEPVAKECGDRTEKRRGSDRRRGRGNGNRLVVGEVFDGLIEGTPKGKVGYRIREFINILVEIFPKRKVGEIRWKVYDLLIEWIAKSEVGEFWREVAEGKVEFMLTSEAYQRGRKKINWWIETNT